MSRHSDYLDSFIKIVSLLSPLKQQERVNILRAVCIVLEPKPEEIEQANTVCQDALEQLSEPQKPEGK